MAETLEITTLRPAPGLTADHFVQANANIDAYLKRQPGFLWRRIVETDDGRIIDIVAYDSMAHARAGAVSGRACSSTRVSRPKTNPCSSVNSILPARLRSCPRPC